MKKIIIAALSSNNVIGREGKIPWHSKEEFKHFKRTTLGFPMIMGRKTFESIGKPLPGRLSLIITRSKKFNFAHESVKIFNNLSDAYRFCEEAGYEKVFIIGGGEIYRRTIHDADSLIITKFPFEIDGDTYFPELNGEEWNLESKEDYDEFTILTYIK